MVKAVLAEGLEHFWYPMQRRTTPLTKIFPIIDQLGGKIFMSSHHSSHLQL